MTDESEKLQRFKKAVSDETDAQVKQMLEDAEKESREIVESARATADQRNKAKFRELEMQTEQRLRREVAAAKLDSHRNVLIRREQLADSVFEDVRRRLSEFRAGNDYVQWIKKTVDSCKAKYPDSKASVYLSPADMSLADKIGVNAVEDSSIVQGGVSVRFENEGIVLDCTFDSMLERERADFCNNKEIVQL